METSKKTSISDQSKQWLVESLLSLMEEKPYKDITIKEICEKALLSRRTYYRNFNSKDEILSLYMSKIYKEYVDMLSEENDLSLKNVSIIYFYFCKNNLDFLLILKKNNLLHLVLQKYDEFLPSIFNTFRGHLNLYKSQEHLEYALSFNTGGLWNILIKWLSDGAKKSPEEMSNILISSISYLSSINSTK